MTDAHPSITVVLVSWEPGPELVECIESLAAAKCPVLFVPPEEDIVLPPFAAAAMAPATHGQAVASQRRKAGMR